MQRYLVPESKCNLLINWIISNRADYEWNPVKNQITLFEHHKKVLIFRLPITYASSGFPVTENKEIIQYILLMIRSGTAAIGYFENGENLDHKVFRAYMTRKKQGKSQIKYLKTKGKSRAGSRVRLAEGLLFFEDINLRLQHYFKNYRIDKIGLSCATTLIPYLFGSKENTPFAKEDPRLFKIPKHIQNPTYENLLITNQYLQQGEIKYQEEGEEIFGQINAFLDHPKHSRFDQEENDENW